MRNVWSSVALAGCPEKRWMYVVKSLVSFAMVCRKVIIYSGLYCFACTSKTSRRSADLSISRWNNFGCSNIFSLWDWRARTSLRIFLEISLSRLASSSWKMWSWRVLRWCSSISTLSTIMDAPQNWSRGFGSSWNFLARALWDERKRKAVGQAVLFWGVLLLSLLLLLLLLFSVKFDLIA